MAETEPSDDLIWGLFALTNIFLISSLNEGFEEKKTKLSCQIFFDLGAVLAMAFF